MHGPKLTLDVQSDKEKTTISVLLTMYRYMQ